MLREAHIMLCDMIEDTFVYNGGLFDGLWAHYTKEFDRDFILYAPGNRLKVWFVPVMGKLEW